MGSYTRSIDPDDLMERRSDQHPAWLADLDGRRLVVADDVKRNARWATGLVKSLVSGEPRRARLMRQDFYEFRPCSQIVLVGNHAPALDSRDSGLSRRLRVLPFRNKPAEPDPLLPQRIDRGEVLRWVLDGARRYLTEGVPSRPGSVAAATADYEARSDPLAEFVEGVIGVELTRAEMYVRYTRFAEQHGHRAMARRTLLATLREDYGALERISMGKRFVLIEST